MSSLLAKSKAAIFRGPNRFYLNPATQFLHELPEPATVVLN